ncbi:MAG: Hsp20/alpha crystallin family protein [Epsilonproteobacteria bacterium]|nr:Hsp20/alpha crystallin family protein [Campylobacterota bacterium]
MRDKILIILTLILVLAVGIEGYYLYKMNQQIKNQYSYYKPIKQQQRSPINSSANSSGGGASFAQISPNAVMINPFKEFQKMQEEMNRVFGSFNAKFQNDPDFDRFFQDFSLSPALDMKDAGDKYIITVEIPGSKKSSINVNVKNHILSVVAKSESVTDNKNANYIQKERLVGNFEREITLPSDADEKSMKTRYDNGVLTITFKKKS